MKVAKVVVDRDECIGAGNCVALLPDVFRLDDENKAVVLDASSASDDELFDAAESCPVKAIFLEDERGRRLYP